MTRGLKAPAFLLGFDAITVRRLVADATLSTTTSSKVWSGRGTVGTPTSRDLIFGDENDRTNVVDATVALPLDAVIQHDDRVDTPRGTFVVVSTETRRLHQRALLRRVG